MEESLQNLARGGQPAVHGLHEVPKRIFGGPQNQSISPSLKIGWWWPKMAEMHSQEFYEGLTFRVPGRVNKVLIPQNLGCVENKTRGFV